MTRRRLTVAVGLGAVAAGAGLARLLREPPGSDTAVWEWRFERPEGGELTLAALRGRPLLLNFWATWCPPCVGEMPLLDRFERDRRSRGWAVVGIVVDNAEPVRRFLAQRPVGFAIGLAGAEGVELARSLGNRGGLPFSVVFGADGKVSERRTGPWSANDLPADPG